MFILLFNDYCIANEAGDFAIQDTSVDLSAGSVSIEGEPVDVSHFDIAGVSLKMPFEIVYNLFFKQKSLYTPKKKNSIIYTIHKDYKYNLDYECRNKKITASASLEKCINTLAKNRGLLYPAELHLERKQTGETLDIFFTSNATDNVVWRVLYKNDVNNLDGAGEKFSNQRDKKILAFWQGVLDKYGSPNSGKDTWASSNNSYDPKMIAYYGSLDLIDSGLITSDSVKNTNQSKENFKAKPYAF